MNPPNQPDLPPSSIPPVVPNHPFQASARPAAPVPPPPPEEPLPANPDIRTLFEALLRRPNALAEHLNGGHRGALAGFMGLAVVCFLLFGLVLGCFAKHEQLWAAPLKTGLGLIIAGVICFPSLYIFSTLAGARIGITQLATGFAAALALAGLLLLGFAPAVWIFAESTDSLGFMGLLAIGSWLAAFAFALKFLKSATAAAGGTQKTPLTIWSIVFLLVTLQMTTSLRPIIGRSDRFLTQEKKFFLQHWGESSSETLPQPKRTD